MKTLIILVAVALAGLGCDKPAETPAETPAEPVAQEEPAAPAEPAAAAEPTADSAPAAEHPSIAGLTDEQWCEVAHSDTVKLVEGIKASMKRGGQEDPTYEAPARDEYVTSCRKLPLPMQKCLVLAYSMQNKDQCQATQDSLSADDQAVYKELMGK